MLIRLASSIAGWLSLYRGIVMLVLLMFLVDPVDAIKSAYRDYVPKNASYRCHEKYVKDKVIESDEMFLTDGTRKVYTSVYDGGGMAFGQGRDYCYQLSRSGKRWNIKNIVPLDHVDVTNSLNLDSVSKRSPWTGVQDHISLIHIETMPYEPDGDLIKIRVDAVMRGVRTVGSYWVNPSHSYRLERYEATYTFAEAYRNKSRVATRQFSQSDPLVLISEMARETSAAGECTMQFDYDRNLTASDESFELASFGIAYRPEYAKSPWPVLFGAAGVLFAAAAYFTKRSA